MPPVGQTEAPEAPLPQDILFVIQALVACGEACANAVQHAYGASEGWVEVDLVLEGTELRMTVRDSGTWRALSPSGGGRGLDLMRGLMDDVDVDHGSDGTEVRMRLRVSGGEEHGRARSGRPVRGSAKP